MVIMELNDGKIRIHDDSFYKTEEEEAEALERAAQVMIKNELRRNSQTDNNQTA